MKEELSSEEPYLGQFIEYELHSTPRTPTIRRRVEAALKGAGKTDTTIPVLTPEMVVGTGGMTLGIILVQSDPIRGVVGAPVIAAVVVMLYILGVYALCEWSAQFSTDEDEKQ